MKPITDLGTAFKALKYNGREYTAVARQPQIGKYKQPTLKVTGKTPEEALERLQELVGKENV